MNNLQFNSVENIPILNAQAAFQVDRRQNVMLILAMKNILCLVCGI